MKRIVLAVACVICLAGCGGQATVSPSPTPTGSLTEEEARYVSDMRADSGPMQSAFEVLGDLVAQTPEWDPETASSAESSLSELESLRSDWESRPMPSARLTGARDYWLSILSHAIKAMDKMLALEGTSGGGMPKVTAEISRVGDITERLTEELDRLEEL